MGSVTDAGILEFCNVSKPDVLICITDETGVSGMSEVHLNGEKAEIAVSVKKEMRGHGLGASLFAEAIKQSQAYGAQEVHVFFHKDNHAVRHLCETHRGEFFRDGDEVYGVIRLPNGAVLH